MIKDDAAVLVRKNESQKVKSSMSPGVHASRNSSVRFMTTFRLVLGGAILGIAVINTGNSFLGFEHHIGIETVGALAGGIGSALLIKLAHIV